MPHTANSDYIDHTGIVMSVNCRSNTVTVKIDECDDCGGCPASKICEATGQTENTVTIVSPHACSYKVGDIVTVRGTEQMHRKAIIYATVLPSVALVAVMVGVYLATFNQLAAALSGIGITIIFYIVLWACRNKIAHEFSFSIIGKPERALKN